MHKPAHWKVATVNTDLAAGESSRCTASLTQFARCRRTAQPGDELCNVHQKYRDIPGELEPWPVTFRHK